MGDFPSPHSPWPPIPPRPQLARKFPVADVPTGTDPVSVGSDDGLMNVLPPGPASTARWVALPPRYWFQSRNHSVQPSSQLPALGLLVIVIGSPGMDIW